VLGGSDERAATTPEILAGLAQAAIPTLARVILGTPPTITTILAVPVLTELAALFAALPAGIVGSRRDPVRILRVA